MAMVLITHDLGAVAGVADRVAVMRAGRLIENGAGGAGARRAARAVHARTAAAARRACCAADAAAPASARVRCAARRSATWASSFRSRAGSCDGRARLRAVQQCELSAAGRRVPRRRRGVRLRQVNARARGAASCCAPPAGASVWMGQALAELARGAAARPAPRAADHLPGSAREPRPAPDGRARSSPSPQGACARARRAGARGGRAAHVARRVGLPRGARRALSARALRRASASASASRAP